MAEAQSYKSPGTPEDQTRRTFMVNAVIALGGVITLGLAIPLLTSLAPAPDALNNEWTPLTAAEWAALQKATDTPIKVAFTLHETDGYLPPVDDQEFVWAIKANTADLKAKRPELFKGPAKLPYAVVNLGFTIFSPVCPHLGCRYSWIDVQNNIHLPVPWLGVHQSSVTHVAGPAPRGLDPLPLREVNGKAELTWIEYKQDTPDHIVLQIG